MVLALVGSPCLQVCAKGLQPTTARKLLDVDSIVFVASSCDVVDIAEVNMLQCSSGLPSFLCCNVSLPTVSDAQGKLAAALQNTNLCNSKSPLCLDRASRVCIEDHVHMACTHAFKKCIQIAGARLTENLRLSPNKKVQMHPGSEADITCMVIAE